MSDWFQQAQNNPQATATFIPSPTIQLPSNNNLPDSSESGNINFSGGQGMTMEDASKLPPLEPIHVNAVNLADAVEIQWQGTALDIAVHYLVYRRIAGTTVWYIIATVPIEGNNRGSYSYQDTTIAKGTSYEYALTIVDYFGNESSFSPIMAINTN